VQLSAEQQKTLAIYRFLGTLLKPYWLRALVAAFITIPIGMLDGTIAFTLKPYIDSLNTGAATSKMWLPVGWIPFIIVGFTAFQGLLNYTSIYLNGWLGLKVMAAIRAKLFTKLQQMDVAYFHKTTTGTLIQAYFRDPESLQANVLNNTKDMLIRIFSSLCLAGVLISISWKLSIMAIGVLLLIIYPSTRIRKRIKQFAQASNAASSDLMSYYTETSNGIQVVYGFNQQAQRMQRFNQSQQGLFSQTMRHIKTQGWLTPIMHTTASLGVGIVIWQGSTAILNKEITTGGLFAFITALLLLYNPIKNLGNSVMTAQMSLMAAGRILDLLAMEPAVKDAPNPHVLAGIEKGIQFEQVYFAYVPEQPVIKNLNISLNKGETVALVGASGSGKSTLASLLMRFYDVNAGVITIDGIPLPQISLHSLRAHIALVTQDNFLFNGTIEDNLRVGKANATQKELWQALEQAYLASFVKGLDQGLATPIGERGVMLSGGQRQRLAIARALLKDAPIVILDEATSALDNESEAIVQQAMDRLMIDRTVLVIAHRLSTIRHADRILVLEAGELVEAGPHEQLLAQNGRYAHYYHTQFNRLAETTTSTTEGPGVLTL
jgi:ATP-binding cassette, subfamily B, bacterial MsbA